MTISVTDNILDSALGQLQAGQSINQVLTSYPEQAVLLNPLLEVVRRLDLLDPVAAPAHPAQLEDRNNFLAEITRLQLQPVTPGPLVRFKEWAMLTIPWLFPTAAVPRREVRQVSTLFLKAALILTIVFGSLSGVIVATENSLPGSPIYSFKLAREEARLALNDDPADEATLHLNLARVRVQEMIRTSAQGDVPLETTMTRLQTHMNEAYRNTAQTADEPMAALLLQAQEMTLDQELALIQAQDQANEQAQTILKETARQMSQWRQETEEGLQDPHQFRLRYGTNRPEDAPVPGGPGGDPEGTTDCTGDCDQDGEKNRYGQGAEEPQPGPGEPRGNQNCSDDCDQGGDGEQHGQDTEEPPPGPGPGEPGGNPECTIDCDQSGDGSQNGQDAEEPPPGPGPGEPGGNPECTIDCDQSGDGSQNGQDAEPPPPGPGPGEPGGNPECTVDCDQSGDGSQNGLDAESPPPGPGPGEPGGNPGCTVDCDQSGDGSQNGQDAEEPPPGPGESGGDPEGDPVSDPDSSGGNDDSSSGSQDGPSGGGKSGG